MSAAAPDLTRRDNHGLDDEPGGRELVLRRLPVGCGAGRGGRMTGWLRRDSAFLRVGRNRLLPIAGKGGRGGGQLGEKAGVSVERAVLRGDKIAGDADQVRFLAETEVNRLLNELKADGPRGVQIGQVQKPQRAFTAGRTHFDIMPPDLQTKRFDQTRITRDTQAAEPKTGEEFPPGEAGFARDGVQGLQ